ncbi:hypothetical protein [Parasitella parasitica]|uniref:Uncharacterized protein n=1 Tax=Parasitella parasitica TaxID=35722 RepID=A0A0B7NPY0_9FUNG|nr:hypothetical protein [Parasitella parasitica]
MFESKIALRASIKTDMEVEEAVRVRALLGEESGGLVRLLQINLSVSAGIVTDDERRGNWLRAKTVEEKRDDSTMLQKRRNFILKLAKDRNAYDKNRNFVDANSIRGEGWSKRAEESTATSRSKQALLLTIFAAISYQGVERVDVKIVRGDYWQHVIQSTYSIVDTWKWNSSRHEYVSLLPYSSFLNAFEECFSKVKTLVKQKPELTQDELTLYIRICSDMVTDSDCEGWI